MIQKQLTQQALCLLSFQSQELVVSSDNCMHWKGLPRERPTKLPPKSGHSPKGEERRYRTSLKRSLMCTFQKHFPNLSMYVETKVKAHPSVNAD